MEREIPFWHVQQSLSEFQRAYILAGIVSHTDSLSILAPSFSGSMASAFGMQVAMRDVHEGCHGPRTLDAFTREICRTFAYHYLRA